MSPRRSPGMVLALLTAAILGSGCQPKGEGKGGKQVVFDSLTAPASLTVTSPDIASGASIPAEFTDYGDKRTPTIQWSAPPPGTKSLAFLIEDPDAPGAEPFVHGIVYDIPASARGIGATPPQGALSGTNSTGASGYFGPRPPQGDPPHHYHFEAFALDIPLTLPPGADRAALLGAMKDHVLARGEMIATYGHS